MLPGQIVAKRRRWNGANSVLLSCIQRSSCLPDENNVAALQEEVKQVKLRELETLRSFREMQDAVTELNQRWQVRQPPPPLDPAQPVERQRLSSTPFSGLCSTTCPAAAARAAAAATGRNPRRRTPWTSCRTSWWRSGWGRPRLRPSCERSNSTPCSWRARWELHQVCFSTLRNFSLLAPTFCSSHFCVRIFTFVLYSDFYIFVLNSIFCNTSADLCYKNNTICNKSN